MIRQEIEHAKIAWAAFRNMLRAARHDPLLAFVHVFLSPLNAIPYFGKILLLPVVIFVVFIVAMALYMDHLNMQGTWLSRTAYILCFPIPLVLLFRGAIAPLILNFGDFDGDGVHGTARFSTNAEIAAFSKTKTGLLLGRDTKTGDFLRYDGPAHLLTMAPTRTGKGVSTIIPNLLTADRSVICVDPKGENARITGRARQKFGPVHVIDPFGVSGQPLSAFNPLGDLDADGLDGAEDAAALADALVYDAPGEAGDAHWNEEAKALIGGILLYVASQEPLRRHTLATLREYLTLAPGDFSRLLERMQACPSAGGLIARAANRYVGKADREASGVLSAAQRHTHFLDSPRMTAVLGRSDFSFGDLKSRTATIFLVLPPDRLGAYSRWLRLMIARSLTDMARTAIKPPAPVLYLLDEFAALGNLAPVERAMGLMAGYGVQLWPILQDVHQLRATYGQRAGTFLSNAAVLQVFGVNDHDSSRLVSDLLGQETVVFQTMSRALDAEATGISLNQHLVGRALMTPDEIRNLPAPVELLFVAGQRPMIARKIYYFEEREFKGRFDQA